MVSSSWIQAILIRAGATSSMQYITFGPNTERESVSITEKRRGFAYTDWTVSCYFALGRVKRGAEERHIEARDVATDTQLGAF